MKCKSVQFDRNRLLGAIAGTVVVGVSGFAFAGETFYQKGESHRVANDSAVTETETMRLTHDARGIEKSGAGVYTLPLGLVDAGNPFALRVHEGRVVVTDGGGAVAAVEAPTSLLNLASFWVDAAVNAATNAAGEVTTWYDCREQATEGVYGNDYCRATTILEPKGAGGVYAPVMPQVETPPGVVRPMVNFGGMKTGTGMNFSSTFSAVRHIFVVADFETSYGFVCGAAVNTQPILHPSNYDKAGVTGDYANTDTEPTTVQGEFLVNGERCNPLHTPVRKGLQLIEIHADYSNAQMWSFGTFFNDRNIAGRYGGDFIGEMLVFNGGTRSLSIEERRRVARYLMDKWGITPSKGGVDAKLAKGAELDIAQKNLASLSGQGVWVKSGSDSAVYRPVAAQRLTGMSVSLEGGSLVADVRELNYAPKAGETVTETVDKFARRVVTSSVDPVQAAAGRVEFKGGGPGIRLGDLGPSVTNLVSDGAETILGLAGLGGATVMATGGAATIANASFETALNEATDWTIEKNDGGVTRLELTTDTQVEDWRVGNPTADFRKDCRHARFYATDGRYALFIHNTSIVRGKVTVPADGDYLFGFDATARYKYDNEELTFSLIDEANNTNTFASCVITYGDGFRPYRLPVRGLKAGAYTLRIAGQQHYSAQGWWGKESFAHIDNLSLVHLADSSATDGAVPVPNGSFELTQIVNGDASAPRHVDWIGYDRIDCAGWTFTGQASAGDDVAPINRYVSKNYVTQGNPYGEWELHFNGSTGRATTKAFSLPAGRWKLRCRAAKWAFADNVWPGYTHGRDINPVVGVKVTVNGEELCDMLSGQVSRYEFSPFTFGNVIAVKATDEIVLEVRQNATSSGTAAANLKVDDFEFVPETAAVELVKNGSFESGNANWTNLSQSGGTWWVNSFSDTADNNWGNQRFDGNCCALFTKRGGCGQTVEFPAAGVYRLSFWARSRVSNYGGVVSTSQFGGGLLRATLVDAEQNAMTLVETPRILSTNFFETATLFKVPTAGSYTLKFEGLDTDDRTTAIDAVSVRPVADASAPQVSEKLNIRLAEGSKLRLDYDGDLSVERLRIGDRRFYGAVDASDASGLITGIGRLVVTGRKPGAAILVR